MPALPVVSHRKVSDFKGGGLRSFFQYRDLGIRKATKGRIGAHVIRAVSKGEKKTIKGSDAHKHALDFQMVYVLKGWVTFEYEGYGKVKLKAGSSVYQPPGIRHREIAHSSDLELIEITAPAAFETASAMMPKKRRRPASSGRGK
jgi:mannose-6-phosphate isomerase-like protein (cupin superfamily)